MSNRKQKRVYFFDEVSTARQEQVLIHFSQVLVKDYYFILQTVEKKIPIVSKMLRQDERRLETILLYCTIVCLEVTDDNNWVREKRFGAKFNHNLLIYAELQLPIEKKM